MGLPCGPIVPRVNLTPKVVMQHVLICVRYLLKIIRNANARFTRQHPKVDIRFSSETIQTRHKI